MDALGGEVGRVSREEWVGEIGWERGMDTSLSRAQLINSQGSQGNLCICALLFLVVM